MYTVVIYNYYNNEIARFERNTITKAQNCAAFWATAPQKRYAECTDENGQRVFWYQNGVFEW